jgi:cell division protein FtsA
VGLPNEHLAKGTEEIASPMYATSIGLVIKGFEKNDMLKNNKSLTNEVPEIISQPTIKGGSFLSSFYEKTRKFFEEDNNKNS